MSLMNSWLNVRVSTALFLVPFVSPNDIGVRPCMLMDRQSRCMVPLTRISARPCLLSCSHTFFALYTVCPRSLGPHTSRRFSFACSTRSDRIAEQLALVDVIPWLAMLEQEMNSIERLKRYNRLSQEAASRLSSDPNAEVWPSQGGITFTDVQLRYRPELPLVLKGLTFDVPPGEKVGIIGRTGAGKSSLVQAIYRTVELAAGEVRVDGVDLSSVGLNTVCSCSTSLVMPFMWEEW